MEIHQCLSLGGSQHSSNGKERFCIKNFMLLMLILHLIYFPQILVSEWKCNRLVSQLQEKKCKMEEISPFTKPHQKMKEVMHSIDPESVRKSPLTEQKILDIYADVFKVLETFPGDPYKFKLKENHVPTRHEPKKVPIHLQDNFHQEINDLVTQGVLDNVEHSTEWVNSFVIFEKDVSMDSGNSHAPCHHIKKMPQICLDPRDLNEALYLDPRYLNEAL